MKLRSIAVAGALFSALVLARPGDANAGAYFSFDSYGSGIHIGRGYYPYWYYYRPQNPYRYYYGPPYPYYGDYGYYDYRPRYYYKKYKRRHYKRYRKYRYRDRW